MDLYSMIQNGAHFKVEVTSEDLVTFADRLITKSQEIKAMELANNPDEEKWLTAEEAAKMYRVCATLYGLGRSLAILSLPRWDGSVCLPCRTFRRYSMTEPRSNICNTTAPVKTFSESLASFLP